MRTPLFLRKVYDVPVVSGLLFALLYEGITALTRFGLGMKATDYEHLHTWATFGIRIHHGYIGLVLLLVWAILTLSGRFRESLSGLRSRRSSIAVATERRFGEGGWRKTFLIIGIALALSDALHHFVVLRLVTGTTEFP